MTTASPPPPSSSPASKNTDDATAAAVEPPTPLPKASSSFGFKRGFLNTNNSSSTSLSSIRSATTSTATVVPPSTIQKTRASSNESGTTDATRSAEAPTPPQPSTEDPQDDECVLCCYPLPLKPIERTYKSCCGEVICLGCIIAEERVLIIGENVEKPIQGSKEEEWEFGTMLTSEQSCVCPFCRAEPPTNDTEMLKRLWRQIDDYNDANAMNMLGGYYMEGTHGPTQNLKNGEELLKRSYNLGHPDAANNLYAYYSDYVPNPVLAKKYLEGGVKRGSAACMNNLGNIAFKSGNYAEATRLWMTAARSGDATVLRNLIYCYQAGLLSKDDLATTLRAHKATIDKGKNESRAYAIRHKDFEEKMVSSGKLRRV